MDVLVIGNNTIDHVFTTRGSVFEDHKSNAIALKYYAGGQAANVAYTLARLGLSVHYLGAFGDDSAGAFSKTSLIDCGVSLEGGVTVHECPNQVAVVIVDCESGSRTIVMYKDDRLRLPLWSVKPEWVNRANLVFIDNHEPEAALEAAMLASRRSIPVLADLEKIDSFTHQILSHVSSLVAPARILCELTGCDDIVSAIKETQKMGPLTSIATVGSAGSIGISGDLGPVFVPASSCDVRDTTGAGDTFHAGYAAAIFSGMDFRSAMEFASLIAAAKCEQTGPRLGESCLIELRKQFLEAATFKAPLRHHFI